MKHMEYFKCKNRKEFPKDQLDWNIIAVIINVFSTQSHWDRLGHSRSYSHGFWMTIRRYSLSGATMISCFFDLILRKVRSFWGSMSRTVLLAFMVSWWRRPAYWTVVELSRVVRIGMPSAFTTIVPITPLWLWILLRVSSTSACFSPSLEMPKSGIQTLISRDSCWRVVRFFSTQHCKVNVVFLQDSSHVAPSAGTSTYFLSFTTMAAVFQISGILRTTFLSSAFMNTIYVIYLACTWNHLLDNSLPKYILRENRTTNGNLAFFFFLKQNKMN